MSVVVRIKCEAQVGEEKGTYFVQNVYADEADALVHLETLVPNAKTGVQVAIDNAIAGWRKGVQATAPSTSPAAEA